MIILALDTSTPACSVALWRDGEAVEVFETAPNRHSSLVLCMVEQVMAESGLRLGRCDAIAFGRGPGSFTGLRIGVGVAQGLALGADLPVLPVSSLQALAARARAPSVLAAIDARMGQVYWGVYRAEAGGHPLATVAGVRLSGPEEIRLPRGERWVAAGTGCDLHGETIEAVNAGLGISFIRRCYPHAMDVARLGAVDFGEGRSLPATSAAPEYVRNKVTG